MTLKWKDGYLTGVKRVDEQHKKLFVSLNDMEWLINRGAISGQEVKDLMNAVTADVQAHFSFEEGCMKRYDCPMAKNMCGKPHHPGCKRWGIRLIIANRIIASLLRGSLS